MPLLTYNEPQAVGDECRDGEQQPDIDLHGDSQVAHCPRGCVTSLKPEQKDGAEQAARRR